MRSPVPRAVKEIKRDPSLPPLRKGGPLFRSPIKIEAPVLPPQKIRSPLLKLFFLLPPVPALSPATFHLVTCFSCYLVGRGLISHGAGLPQHRGQIRPAQRLSESRSTGWTNNGRSRSAARRRQVRAAQRTKTRASAHPPWQRTVKSNRRQVAIADQTASRRSPCERSPRTVAGLVPVPWLISIAGLVKVGAVGCCAATDVLAVSRPLESGATNVRAATDSCATGRSSNENTVAAPAVAPMIADRRFAL